MLGKVKPIPEGYHTITPFIIVKGADKFIDFLKNAFDAREIDRYTVPGGDIMHAEVRIGDSPLMLAEASDKHGPMPGGLYLYVNDVDTTYKRALEAGATSIMEPSDQFYGDRSGGVKDSFGNSWWIGTHIEDVSHEEIERRQKEMGKS